jgi:hypothetical protein
MIDEKESIALDLKNPATRGRHRWMKYVRISCGASGMEARLQRPGAKAH